MMNKVSFTESDEVTVPKLSSLALDVWNPMPEITKLAVVKTIDGNN